MKLKQAFFAAVFAVASSAAMAFHCPAESVDTLAKAMKILGI